MADSIPNYRTLTLRCDTVNDWMPTVTSTTDDGPAGRRLRAVLTDGGQDVDPSGLGAQLLYNPSPTDPTMVGDLIAMTAVTGQPTATFEVDLPASLTATAGRKRLAVRFTQGSGSTQTMVATRAFTLQVEAGALNASETATGPGGQLDKAIDTAQQSALSSSASADRAEQAAKNAAASASNAAIDADRAAEMEESASVAEEFAEKKATDAATSATRAADSAATASSSATSAQSSAATAEQAADRAAAAVNNFSMTAGPTSTLAAGSQATAAVRRDGNAWKVDFGIPQGIPGTSAARIRTVTIPPTDFTDRVADVPVDALGAVNVIGPASTADAMDAWLAAMPLVQDHDDDPAIPAGSIRVTCTNEPTGSLTLRIVIMEALS